MTAEPISVHVVSRAHGFAVDNDLLLRRSYSSQSDAHCGEAGPSFKTSVRQRSEKNSKRTESTFVLVSDLTKHRTKNHEACLMSSARAPNTAMCLSNLQILSHRQAHAPPIYKPREHAYRVGAFRFDIKHALPTPHRQARAMLLSPPHCFT